MSKQVGLMQAINKHNLMTWLNLYLGPSFINLKTLL